MFTRSILIPSLIACAIAAPILFSQAKNGPTQNDQNPLNQDPYLVNGYGPTYVPNNGFGNANGGQPAGNPFQQASSSSFQNAPTGNPVFHQASSSGYPAFNPAFNPASNPANNQPIYGPGANNGMTAQMPTGFDTFPTDQAGIPNLSGMTPDYGATQTVILPGNAFGPDVNAAPLEFMPITNFEEIFRFTVDSNWIKKRWNRVSTSPGDYGLHGLRVALVTGTNSWDLHGSLTYFFDGNQRVQRITFRGWAGDASRLTDLLTQRYGFKSQPTHWAGYYLAENKRKPIGGMLMQHPAVIYTENPVQQIAVVMEMNNPQGKFQLSDDFRSLIVGSQQTR